MKKVSLLLILFGFLISSGFVYGATSERIRYTASARDTVYLGDTLGISIKTDTALFKHIQCRIVSNGKNDIPILPDPSNPGQFLWCPKPNEQGSRTIVLSCAKDSVLQPDSIRITVDVRSPEFQGLSKYYVVSDTIKLSAINLGIDENAKCVFRVRTLTFDSTNQTGIFPGRSEIFVGDSIQFEVCNPYGKKSSRTLRMAKRPAIMDEKFDCAEGRHCAEKIHVSPFKNLVLKGGPYVVSEARIESDTFYWEPSIGIVPKGKKFSADSIYVRVTDSLGLESTKIVELKIVSIGNSHAIFANYIQWRKNAQIDIDNLKSHRDRLMYQKWAKQGGIALGTILVSASSAAGFTSGSQLESPTTGGWISLAGGVTTAAISLQSKWTPEVEFARLDPLMGRYDSLERDFNTHYPAPDTITIMRDTLFVPYFSNFQAKTNSIINRANAIVR